MKVICINENWVADSPIKVRTPHFMEECEVIDTAIDLFGSTWFILAGFNPDSFFHSQNFAILPDQSDDEINQAEKECVVNIETPVV